VTKGIEIKEDLGMSNRTKQTTIKPGRGTLGEKGFAPAASAGQAQVIHQNPNGAYSTPKVTTDSNRVTKK